VLRPLLIAAGLSIASSAGATEYILGNGDTVRVEVHDEFVNANLVVENCAISVQFIQQVEVCGKSTAEVAAVVRARLAPEWIRTPEVSVSVQEYGSQRVEVIGEVRKPKTVALRGPSKLSEVITEAGGPASENVLEAVIKRTGAPPMHVDLRSDGWEEIPVVAGDVVQVLPARQVAVSGQVQKESQIPFVQGMTALRAVSEAGGVTEFAHVRRVYVLRGGERIPVNLKRIRDGRDADVALEPGDAVVVP
jgi:polysaccharide export outer membrane protein